MSAAPTDLVLLQHARQLHNRSSIKPMGSSEGEQALFGPQLLSTVDVC